ncbi:MAG: hypothetical protein AB1758_37255 [Candidatus Eremiobacterota bacterium]
MRRALVVVALGTLLWMASLLPVGLMLATSHLLLEAPGQESNRNLLLRAVFLMLWAFPPTVLVSQVMAWLRLRRGDAKGAYRWSLAPAAVLLPLAALFWGLLR